MTVLCPLDAIPDPGAREFRAMVDGEARRVFVVRKDGQVFGYVNSCPHVGAPLNLEDDKFLDLFQTSILCANHFALFDIESGACTRGPCQGRSLQPFPVEVRDGDVVRKA
ncbi:putative Ferredoxin subunits of nitrite reductase and ring-hydroxylating dioxygenase [Magnetospirillum sp. XM-1]|uniref:Rieske (2Fe-2S) protein n=1 Tax=Magnetospirillum sp. XM-1 TaxID=1663591 RepID=UPI00073DC416|nr:Rieske (2Fe-2S) protein [Magnetospirillum sp. XM-1]CUW37487.1 putative Ferredoxin subunits of nitrite reductase and ring-hydroxylating dioxygenase [Magnetospirillum sp. XM-1]